MFGNKPILASAALVCVCALAGGARANWGTALDTLSPVAHAAVVEAVATQATSRPAGVAHEIPRSSDGLFYTHALVNGQKLRFLVDTGASVVVLTAADARAAGLAIEDKHYNRSVDTVGGAAPMAWATLDRVDLAGHELRNLRVAVVRNGLGVSLMGQNMLERLNSVTITADKLSIR